MAPFTFIDLFAGMGSFHYSLNKLGGTCVGACELNRNARGTYLLNYGVQPSENIFDLVPEDLPDFDVLTAGIPCQPFSSIGAKRGLDDARGQFIPKLVEILKSKRPQIFVVENVQGLLSHDQGKTFQTILSQLACDGQYTISWKLLNSLDFGLPQSRKRVFIIGLRSGQHIDFDTLQRISTPSLTHFLNHAGVEFENLHTRTIRCNGRRSKTYHVWDRYRLTGDTGEYLLTTADMKKLQGFPDAFEICGSVRQQEIQLGNTIPTCLTHVVGELLKAALL